MELCLFQTMSLKFALQPMIVAGEGRRRCCPSSLLACLRLCWFAPVRPRRSRQVPGRVCAFRYYIPAPGCRPCRSAGWLLVCPPIEFSTLACSLQSGTAQPWGRLICFRLARPPANPPLLSSACELPPPPPCGAGISSLWMALGWNYYTAYARPEPTMSEDITVTQKDE